MSTARWKLNRGELKRTQRGFTATARKLRLTRAAVCPPPNASYRDWQRFTVGGRRLPQARHRPFDDAPRVLWGWYSWSGTAELVIGDN